GGDRPEARRPRKAPPRWSCERARKGSTRVPAPVSLIPSPSEDNYHQRGGLGHRARLAGAFRRRGDDGLPPALSDELRMVEPVPLHRDAKQLHRSVELPWLPTFVGP